MSEEPSFYESIENLKKLCNFLRSSDGPLVREAIEMDKRVYYLKGEKLVTFLLEGKKGSKWPKDLPRFKSRNEAIFVCKNLCSNQFIHRSERVAKGELEISRNQDFDETAFFTWIYEGDMKFSHLMTTLVIAGFLFFVCFPIWPHFLKVAAWYMSVTMLLFLVALLSARGSLFLFLWVLGYECWFLPNLFDEHLGFYDSFKPVISFQRTKDGQLLWRLAIGGAFVAFCWWAVTQPSEFDGFKKAQNDFIKDLYAGTLLSDVSQKDKENIDKPKMESLADLLKKLDSSDDPEEEEELSEEELLDSMLDSLVDQEEILDSNEE
jgi:translocation protein SEC62